MYTLPAAPRDALANAMQRICSWEREAADDEETSSVCAPERKAKDLSISPQSPRAPTSRRT